MGILSAAVGVTRYRVVDPVPGDFWSWAADRVAARAFREREPDTAERRSGWAAVAHPLEEGVTLADMAFGDYLVLALRVDERRLPAAVLKKHCLREEARVAAETGRRRLPRQHRAEIRERVRRSLLARALAVPKTADFTWHVSTGQVLFLSCQTGLREAFEDLFLRTFERRLHPVVPYLLAQELLPDVDRRRALAELRAEVLV
ncbi:recombination-associated protein RdgC [Dissulfurirhabdus thermomarina]|uniref:Recombination-associated protein RdgC n=1 Tax=Dissulfurirhabdus thermomarina TaxID=1765737 RepID=A0A6N9TPU1_DISTH|nr:recombination-associated protein RdgC [Dissulfurirhabdus thermomarina]NDY43285.1 recombination-associated protein RdgC [Dissulfurirhabdus thermomarina]NMX24493.1 recombination-associated protein RdgC [Dissulfurirhabdus thermomarina]